MSKQFRHLLAVALILLFSGSANAFDLTDRAEVLSKTFSSESDAGGFVDTFDFELSVPSFFTADVLSRGLEDLSLIFVNETNPGVEVFTDLSTPSFSTGTLNMAAGDYLGIFVGNVTSTPGFYALGLTATPVPEPKEWLMLLAGLVFVGYVARRRTV